MEQLIGRRLKFAREQAGLRQAELSKRLGFKDRQTLAAIEAGQRRLSAAELLAAMQVLALDLEFFTDSFRLVGEGQFSFRAAPEVSARLLDHFEERAGRWVATYRRLGEMERIPVTPLEHRLALSMLSSYEEAGAAAESLVREWELGDVPAANLEVRIRERLGALLLHVDVPAGISGAACQLPGLNTILINRREPEGRRNYDLAHEVFHLLTWEQMPPAHHDSGPLRGGRSKERRIEQLAENFAGALLMPEAGLAPRWAAREHGDTHGWLNATASTLRVTAVALKWRVHNLGWLSKAELTGISDQLLVANGRPMAEQSVPPLFGREFVARLHSGLEHGRLSVRRAASLLDLPMEELGELFQEHGLSVPFEA